MQKKHKNCMHAQETIQVALRETGYDYYRKEEVTSPVSRKRLVVEAVQKKTSFL
jgi:serine protease inhibitor ecotin